MTVNINRSADDTRETYQRVYERIERAKYARAASIEITRQEAFDLFNRQTTYNVITGVRQTEGVDMSKITVGTAGAVIGFPCVIVDFLTAE